MPETIADLVEKIDGDRSIASEVLTKLGSLVSTNGDVVFELPSGNVTVPSIPKLQGESLGQNVGDRITDVENLTRGLVQIVDRLNRESDTPRSSPFWTALDLADGDNAAKTNDPFYRAQVEDGIRLPFDGFTQRTIDRKFTGSAAKIGDFMLPNHTTTTEDNFTSVPSGSSYVDVNEYSLLTGTRTYQTTYRYRRYVGYYGYYYRYYWWYYGYYWYYYPYYYYYYYYAYYTVTNTVNVYTNLDGSLVAQTHSWDAPRVIVGLQAKASYVSEYRADANPRIYMVKTAYGAPDLSEVLCKGTLEVDQETSKSGTTVATLTFNLDKPVVVEANTSYAVVFEADDSFRILYTANQDSRGGLFYTQDRNYWEQEIAKDLALTFVYADFGSDTTKYIDLPAIELSGGIASARQTLSFDSAGDSTENNSSSSLGVQININGTWYDIDYINEVNSLPPFMEARLKMTGSQYLYPVVNTSQSNITAFRPATEGRFISVNQSSETTDVKVSYELLGFNETFHQFDPALMIGTTRYTPDAIEAIESQDGSVRNVTATYALPSASNWFHDIRWSTNLATQTFDISSVIRLNA